MLLLLRKAIRNNRKEKKVEDRSQKRKNSAKPNKPPTHSSSFLSLIPKSVQFLSFKKVSPESSAVDNVEPVVAVPIVSVVQPIAVASFVPVEFVVVKMGYNQFA